MFFALSNIPWGCGSSESDNDKYCFLRVSSSSVSGSGENSGDCVSCLLSIFVSVVVCSGSVVFFVSSVLCVRSESCVSSLGLLFSVFVVGLSIGFVVLLVVLIGGLVGAMLVELLVALLDELLGELFVELLVVLLDELLDELLG